MQTTDQVAGEAREKLADEVELLCSRQASAEQADQPYASHFLGKDLAKLIVENRTVILAALRAQPERGAEEMLTDPVAVHANMLRGVIAKPSVENIVHLYGEDALRRALPLHPAKDEGE